MQRINCQALDKFLALYRHQSSVSLLINKLDDLFSDNQAGPQLDKIISIYNESIPLIEAQLWAGLIDDQLIASYQQLFQEFEQHMSCLADDARHEIVIVIPVADRPQHLNDCLNSLLGLCRAYNYGGTNQGRYRKISVLVADDSKSENNISANKALVKSFDDQGLTCRYFGQQEQLQLLDCLNDDSRQALLSIIGDIDVSDFYHKGASITRNISYLKLKQLTKPDDKVIYYFVDSDQEFSINSAISGGDNKLYAINYFYYLDQVFSNGQVQILTGKVVGDPPVSPSVMAGRFIDDVILFLSQLSELDEKQQCQFHNDNILNTDDASYHDMAELFGFSDTQQSYPYNCTITEFHDHAACLNDFSNKINRFFDGEHPTRKTVYEYENAITSIKPARTVYTGNYAITPEVLDYFIPFAGLKLRMAGPVLGRIVKSEIGPSFVSANLPMLHKRTVEALGQSEFRTGINKVKHKIDLHGEFERQFFGDVMLFTVEQLADLGYPQNKLSEDQVSKILMSVDSRLHQKYLSKQVQIQAKLASLKLIFENNENWWNQDETIQPARLRFEYFIANIDSNFGDNSAAYNLINSTEYRKNRLSEILNAIMSYSNDRKAWQQALNEIAKY